jgi:hypothetical protein
MADRLGRVRMAQDGSALRLAPGSRPDIGGPRSAADELGPMALRSTAAYSGKADRMGAILRPVNRRRHAMAWPLAELG